MSIMKEDPTVDLEIAARVRTLRAARRLSLDDLAAASGVSRSMISLIERGKTSPTAALLDKLAGGLGVPLASLFERGATRVSRSAALARKSDQPRWEDPQTGYVRTTVTPAGLASTVHVTEVRFPPKARIAFENTGHATIHQQIWMLDGVMEVSLGDESYTLRGGDCFSMRLDAPTMFHNPGPRAARYAVILTEGARA